MAVYTPAQGDFISISFDPQAGHEQRGRRPALTLSNSAFNKATGMAIVCPLTNTDRGIPFHLAVPQDTTLTGFAVIEQAKSVDYQARQAKYISSAPSEFTEHALAILRACL
ncbi:MAG: type II toxin-antitoxin system PemK/MazF family toxin [Pirellulales bacterium]|nr:type II toxin-antitoxin system PemK/MazF family toxin [Pirellulales bacterium]